MSRIVKLTRWVGALALELFVCGAEVDLAAGLDDHTKSDGRSTRWMRREKKQ